MLWERGGDRTELQHIDPHSYGHNSVSFPFSYGAQPGAPGPTLLGASFLYRILSPTDLNSNCNCSIGGPRDHSVGCCLSLRHLVSNWLNFLCTELYNSSTPTFFLWASQIALIQPVHGQDYFLIFLDRMHLLFTQVHFLILTAWPGRRSIYNTTKQNQLHNSNEGKFILTRSLGLESHHLFFGCGGLNPLQGIIIMSCHQHGYPWPFLATPLYRPSLPAGLQGNILYRYRAAECKFRLVVLSLLDHVKGSTGLCHLWIRPYFSSGVPHICFV